MDRFRAMQIFTRVVEARSFSKAAKALTLSPASVTTTIQSLEKRFGVRLLLRTTRRLMLTHAGAAYYERCRSILADLEQAEAQLFGAAAEPKGVTLQAAFARERGYPFVDYTRVLSDGDGFLKSEYSSDGIITTRLAARHDFRARDRIGPFTVRRDVAHLSCSCWMAPCQSSTW